VDDFPLIDFLEAQYGEEAGEWEAEMLLALQSMALPSY